MGMAMKSIINDERGAHMVFFESIPELVQTAEHGGKIPLEWYTLEAIRTLVPDQDIIKKVENYVQLNQFVCVYKVQILDKGPKVYKCSSRILTFDRQVVVNTCDDYDFTDQYEEPRLIRCAFCAYLHQKHELKRCGRCRCVYYCGHNCQRGDWENHKTTCAKFKKLTDARSSIKKSLSSSSSSSSSSSLSSLSSSSSSPSSSSSSSSTSSTKNQKKKKNK
jgi:hypothetical protein